MRRADRLFDIIQTLRATPRPITARALADQLEVTDRTIYRDVGYRSKAPPGSGMYCDAALIFRP